MEELTRQSIFWQELITVATWAIFAATLLYVFFVARTLRYIRGQFEEAKTRRIFDITLSIFREIQPDEVRRARRYIYERVPWDVHGLTDSDLQTHMIEAERAIATFDLMGYLLKEGHISKEATLAYYWRGVWKCFKKSERLLRWARQRRNEPVFENLDYLFHECEEYRREHGYPEPTL